MRRRSQTYVIFVTELLLRKCCSRNWYRWFLPMGSQFWKIASAPGVAGHENYRAMGRLDRAGYQVALFLRLL